MTRTASLPRLLVGVAGLVLLSTACSLNGSPPAASATPTIDAAGTAPTNPGAIPTLPPPPPPSPVAVPPTPSFIVQILASDYGRLEAKAPPGATCTARGAYQDGRAVAGLDRALVSDSGGHVVWVYARAPGMVDQVGSYTVNCQRGASSDRDTSSFQTGSS